MRLHGSQNPEITHGVRDQRFGSASGELKYEFARSELTRLGVQRLERQSLS